MSEPTDNQKRAEQLAKQNARTQERLERRRITLERRQEAEAIVEETGGKKEHALNIYKAQLEMAKASQKRIEEQYLRQIQELEDKLFDLEEDIETEREESLKKLEAEREEEERKLKKEFQEKQDKLNEKFDKSIDKQKEKYEERIKKLKSRLKDNENRPQVKNMEMIIENTKNIQTFKKKTVAEVARELEKTDIDEALELVPEIRQNEVVQSHKKENDKLLIEQKGPWNCWGCMKKNQPYVITFELPALEQDGCEYCRTCVRDGIPI